MPCYKESLEGVIKPTIRSLKEAIARYEMQGGTANIFVNDDGLQLVSEADRVTRLEYYEEMCIGWASLFFPTCRLMLTISQGRTSSAQSWYQGESRLFTLQEKQSH